MGCLRVVVTVAAMVGIAGSVSQAEVAVQRVHENAVAAVRRTGFKAREVTGTERLEQSPYIEVRVDGRWKLDVVAETGKVVSLSDADFRTQHASCVLGDSPAPAEILRVGLALIQQVFPDVSMREMTPVRTWVEDTKGPRVAAGWVQVISENGFRAGGRCSVEYCWPDHAIASIRAYAPPTPDAWRRPETVTAAQAEETARRELGEIGDGWFETAKDRCVLSAMDIRPAWQVHLVRRLPHFRRARPVRGVWVDPWTGEVLRTATFDSAAGAASEAPRSPIGPEATGMPADAAPRPWLPWAGGAAAAVAVAVACLRRRRG